MDDSSQRVAALDGLRGSSKPVYPQVADGRRGSVHDGSLTLVDRSEETSECRRVPKTDSDRSSLQPTTTTTNDDRLDRRTTRTGTSQCTNSARIHRTTAVKETWPAGSIGS